MNGDARFSAVIGTRAGTGAARSSGFFSDRDLACVAAFCELRGAEGDRLACHVGAVGLSGMSTAVLMLNNWPVGRAWRSDNTLKLALPRDVGGQLGLLDTLLRKVAGAEQLCAAHDAAAWAATDIGLLNPAEFSRLSDTDRSRRTFQAALAP